MTSRKNKLIWAVGGIAVVLVAGLVTFVTLSMPKVEPAIDLYPPRPDKNAGISVGKTPESLKVLEGYVIHVFAEGLGEARDLEFSPGGTLLVSDIASASVTALPDRDVNGLADTSKVVVRGQTAPHGLAFYGDKLYVAEVERVVRYNWDEVSLTATLDKVLFKLPAGGGHNRRSIVFDNKGNLYVSVGSTCNVCIETDLRSATIMQSDADGSNLQVYAKGLRNAPFMDFDSSSGELWATEMGRDNLGDNIPPDEINVIKSGVDYGWPRCYGNRVHDREFDKAALSPCSATQAPVYEIPAHSAPLGLVFIKSPQFSDQKGNLLVAYHGSWNRSVPDGYKVVLLDVEGGAVKGAKDFITGFSNATARPVDVDFDKHGSLYVSDDKAGKIYIIQKLR
jgi:glucose/arabinose dehydrogenase